MIKKIENTFGEMVKQNQNYKRYTSLSNSQADQRNGQVDR